MLNEGNFDEKLDLETFQGLLFQNFKNNPSYEKIRPKTNQSARLYATANTSNFNDIDKVIVEKLKFRPIVNQTDTGTYDATRIIGEYLKPLVCNDCLHDVLNDCHKFPDMLKMLPPLQKDEDYVFYDFDSLFKNILLSKQVVTLFIKSIKQIGVQWGVPYQ